MPDEDVIPAPGSGPGADGDEGFRTLFDFLPIGAYRSTPQGRPVRVNRAMARLSGFADESELLDAMRDIARDWYVQPQRRAELLAALDRDGAITGWVSEVQRHDGTRIWVRESAHAVRDAHGRVVWYEGTVEDVTAHVRAEQALRDSEQRLREITEKIPGMVYRSIRHPDGRHRFTFVSAGVKALYGITPDEAMREPNRFERFRHPDDRAWVSQAVAHASREALPLRLEYRIIAPDGSVRWIQLDSTPAGHSDEGDARVGVILDITDRRRVLEELRSAEQRWMHVLQSVGEIVWDWNLATGERETLGNLQAMFGYTGDEIDVRHEGIDRQTHPDDLAALDAARQAHFDGRTPRYAVERRVRCKDGSWKWVLARGILIERDGAGRPQRMVGTLADVTAQHEAETLRRAAEHAAAADRAKTELLSRVSHELRTPLNAIMGFAQLLEMAPDLPPRHTRWVQEMLGAGRHLVALVDDILDLAAAQSPDFRVQTGVVDAVGALDDAWSLLAAQAGAAGIRRIDHFARDGADVQSWRVHADARRLTQVFANLLSNAIKYNRADGRIDITLSQTPAAAAGPQLRVAITDTGMGIDPQALERLFAPFERLGAERSAVRGTGLGLAVSRQLVEAMGGAIEVASRPGAGTTFTVVLPQAGVTAPASAPPPPTSATDPTADRTPG